MQESHFRFDFALVFAICVVVVAPGCSKDDGPVPVQANSDGTMAEWRTMMETPAESLDNPRLKQLAVSIGQTAPHYVDEMIAELDDPALSGSKLIALVASLEEVVSPGLVPRLVTFTDSDKPGLVRGAATYLLGRVVSDEATAALESLRNDEIGTVRLSALLGLAERGDADAGEALRALYAKEGTTTITQQSIVLAVSQIPRDADRPMLEDAIQSSGHDQQTYLNAVSALGRIGTMESIGALNTLKARDDSSVGVREMCDNTIAAIEERFETASASSN